jgi:hypothetical protein
MGGAVCYDFNPLAFDSVAIPDPDALAVTVAAMGVTGVGFACCMVPSPLKTYMW